jgi:hypothetical protein
MHEILLLAFLQAAAAQTSPALEPVHSGCSADDPQITAVSAADRVEVEMARAGEGPSTCYKIAFSSQGQTLTGYVFGDSLPAIRAFVKLREKESREAAEAQARLALAAPHTNSEPAKAALDPSLPSRIDDFSWHDFRGKAGSLSSMGGRVTLVTFWPPNSLKSRDQLNSIMPLYNQLHSSGLAAVGIGMTPNTKGMDEVLDDTNFAWPQVPDRDGLAARYHVNPKSGETFVLDASHHVVAAGPMGPEIEKAVRQLLAAP